MSDYEPLPPHQQALLDVIKAKDPQRIESLLEEMHPADIAHWLESLPSEQRNVVWPLLTPDITGEV